MKVNKTLLLQTGAKRWCAQMVMTGLGYHMGALLAWTGAGN